MILKIDVFLQKTSREYILLGTFEQKMAFSVIFKPKRAQNRRFFAVFVYFGRLGGLILLLRPPLPPPPDWALPPPIVGAPSSSGATHTVSSCF
jgi:hypothetical protein